ncbi:hypothetical protein RFM99_19805 [Mesorhizobium sp. VK4C]|uniref:hypothetical protein n=1 Tax=Mesorhizobium captivum TaxID=3072319 RepID=UPI002A23BE51|nr:hypothetical protein [Mesorhizobium sp. VK4C]MDX8500653.1 hypothetical protein [Mesorhizobium sp. VK4C]
MFLEILRIIGGIGGATILMAATGSIAGHFLRTLSRRVTSERLAWLLGDLSAAEAFGIGLMLMTFVAAAFQGWIGLSTSRAWFENALGAGVAFLVFLTVSRRNRKQPSS